MAADGAITIAERRKYLKRMQGRYQAAEQPGRSALLSEMEAVTGLHRKSLTRLTPGGSLARHTRTRVPRRLPRRGPSKPPVRACKWLPEPGPPPGCANFARRASRAPRLLRLSRAVRCRLDDDAIPRYAAPTV